MVEARITIIVRDDSTAGTHVEAIGGAEPITVLDRAIAALQAERKALGNCPVHRGPTFRQEIERLARHAQSIGAPLEKRLRYGFQGEPLRGLQRDRYERRSSFWLNAASALRLLAEKARREEMFHG